MKRNLSTPILKLDGSDFPSKFTLGSAMFLAVTSVVESDNGNSADQKLKLYRLAQKLSAGDEVDFTIEELAMLKERVGKVILDVVILGRVFDLLDEKSAGKEKPSEELPANS